MYTNYKDKETRKKYLVEYRKRKNTEEYKAYRRKYYQDNREKYRNIYRKRHKTLGEQNIPFKGKAGIGRKYELMVHTFLKDSIDCNRTNFRGKWDIEWKGKKIDVKTKNPNKTYGHYIFNWDNHEYVDYYFLICLKNDLPYKMYLIPKEVLPKTGVYLSQVKDTHNYEQYVVKVI